MIVRLYTFHILLLLTYLSAAAAPAAAEPAARSSSVQRRDSGVKRRNQERSRRGKQQRRHAPSHAPAAPAVTPSATPVAAPPAPAPTATATEAPTGSPVWTPLPATPTGTPSATPTQTATPFPTGSPCGLLGDLFSPLSVYVPIAGILDSYVSCSPSGIDAYACGNLSGSLNFTANCSVNFDGTKTCSAELVGPEVYAYLSQQKSYIMGTLGSMMYNVCYESGVTSCEIWGPNGSLFLDNNKWHAECSDSIVMENGILTGKASCVGNFHGDLSFTGELLVVFTVPFHVAGCPMTLNASIGFTPHFAGGIYADEDFEAECPGVIDLNLCTPAKRCTAGLTIINDGNGVSALGGCTIRF